MSSAKQKMSEVIASQPDDATYEEIMRELAFERMVARGLEDSRVGRVIRTKRWNGAYEHGRNKMDRGSPSLAARNS